jgi:hypothetical protein
MLNGTFDSIMSIAKKCTFICFYGLVKYWTSGFSVPMIYMSTAEISEMPPRVSVCLRPFAGKIGFQFGSTAVTRL